MSKKQVQNEFNGYKKDQQFQVYSLGQNSSQSSSRRDRDYQIPYYDEDSEQQQKNQVKSLEDALQSRDQLQNQFQIQKHQGNKFYQEEERQYKQQVFQSIEKAQNKAIDDLNYESQLQKKKRRRRKIFQNIKSQNTNNSNGLTPMQRQNNSKQAQKQKVVRNRVAFQKKKQNHSMLKTWNYARLKNLEFHKNITDQILRGVQKNMKLSMENFQAFKSFYTQRCRQQEVYASESATVIANEDLQLQQNRLSQEVYIACSAIFQMLTKKQIKQKQITLQFVNFMQVKIIKQIFQQYFDNIHKQFLEIYEKILVMKEELKKIDDLTCKKLINLQNSFGECCENVNKQPSKDFYRIELSFLSKCQSEMLIEQNYGKLMIQYYLAAIDQEKKRKLLIQKSLKLYNNGLRKYQKDMEVINHDIPGQESMNSRLNRLKNEQQSNQIQIQGDIQQIKKMYNIQNFLQPEIVRQIKSKVREKDRNETNSQTQGSNKSQGLMTFQQLSKYFSKCQVQQFSCHHLIMKKFGIEVFKDDKWIPGQLVITIDKFLHVFVHALRSSGVLVFGSRTFFKPETSIKIHYVSITSRKQQNENEINIQQDLQVIIGIKKPQKTLGKIASLLKINKNVQEIVRFTKQYDLIQFQDYIAQLSN